MQQGLLLDALAKRARSSIHTTYQGCATNTNSHTGGSISAWGVRRINKHAQKECLPAGPDLVSASANAYSGKEIREWGMRGPGGKSALWGGAAGLMEPTHPTPSIGSDLHDVK